MSKSLEIDIVWGGYYASIPADDIEISVFRLLDFNQDVYHAVLFAEKFTTIPTLEELTMLSPLICHAPIDVMALLREDELRLIGGKPITHEDLEGYMYYLGDCDVPQEEMEELSQCIIGFSHQPPLRVRLEIVNEELMIYERE